MDTWFTNFLNLILSKWLEWLESALSIRQATFFGQF